MDTIVKTKSRPMAVGRPAVYGPNEEAILSTTIEMLGNGETQNAVASKIGVAYSTFKRWSDKHPRFRDALKKGNALADEKVVNALFKRATGTATTKETKFFQHEGYVTDQKEVIKEVQPDVAAAKHWLKHRSSTKEEWKDAQKVEIAQNVDISLAISHAITAGGILERGQAMPTESLKLSQSDIIEAETEDFNPFGGEDS